MLVADASPSCSIVAATVLEPALAPPLAPMPVPPLPLLLLPPTVTLLMMALWLAVSRLLRATELLEKLLVVVRLPLPVVPFGEDASIFMMAFRAVVLVVASKLFDVVTSDT